MGGGRFKANRAPDFYVFAISMEIKDNGYDLNGVCKGRVFLASEKFNPVRECGPGFRKNLLYLEKKV